MEELIKKLAMRHVSVTLEMKPRNVPRRDLPIGNYVPDLYIKAKVETQQDWYHDNGSPWPSFTFTVTGRSLAEVQEAIEHRILVAEPIINATELRYAHEAAVKEARKVGDNLNEAVNGASNVNAKLRVDARTGGEWRG